MIIRYTALTGARAQILTANVQALNLAYEQPRLQRVFNQANYVVCDGFGVLWASRLLGQPLPGRFSPPDWLPNVAELCVGRGLSVFFLGNRPGVGERAAAKLQAQFPGLIVAGVHHGHFDKRQGGIDNQRVVELINRAKPAVLYVGFGMPTQEYWLDENWCHLEANVAITVGAMLDYVAGDKPRGPRWATDNGLEWLTRLLTEPSRLWRRYLVGNPLFLVRLLRQRSTKPPERHG